MIYQLLDADTARTMGAELLKLDGWHAGRARTAALTGTVKRNLELLPSDHERAAKLSGAIAQLMLREPELQRDCFPLKVHPPKFSHYSDGGAYGRHSDAPWMAETRTDLSATLWLSDDYEGGELVVEGLGAFKGQLGQCLVYECGRIHHVAPVTSGRRVCAVTWIESRLRDPQQRKLVAELRKLLAELEAEHPQWHLMGSRVHSGLLRMWCE